MRGGARHHHFARSLRTPFLKRPQAAVAGSSPRVSAPRRQRRPGDAIPLASPIERSNCIPFGCRSRGKSVCGSFLTASARPLRPNQASYHHSQNRSTILRTLPLSGRLGACSVEEDSLRRPVHSRGWLDGLFAQESRSSSSSLVCSVSRRILESNPGPSVSPEWTGTTVVRPSGCRIK